MIIGVDEVGRGCWAGPLVIAAVALEPDAVLGLKDSKLLSAQRRKVLAAEIRQAAAWIGIGWVSAKHIDEIGLSAALYLAAKRAIIGAPQADIIIDGTIKLIDSPRATTLKKADQLIPAVSAASIIAKVARDRYMQKIDSFLPQYGFGAHVGYGTAQHVTSLEMHGPTALHRMSFAPLAKWRAAEMVRPHAKRVAKNASGTKAETQAAAYLERHGFTILDRNWKTKMCEIDIIAQKDSVLYFTEVKYRKDNQHGSGAEAITTAKLRQMQFAAEAWCAAKRWSGAHQLAAIEVSGEAFKITRFETNIVADPLVHARTRLS